MLRERLGTSLYGSASRLRAIQRVLLCGGIASVGLFIFLAISLPAHATTSAFLVKDIAPGPDPSYPRELTNVGGTLFLQADDRINGRELWKSNGTSAGTQLVQDINPGGYESYPTYLTSNDGALFFAARDAEHGNELWQSDGTANGTFLITDLVPGFASSSPSELAKVNGSLFFLAKTTSGDQALWKTDGTQEGTRLVTDTFAGEHAYPSSLMNVAGTLFFGVATTAYGYELWKSDGTAAGTSMIKDIRPGPAGSNPNGLLISGNVLFFTADDGSHGVQWWKTDGTSANTIMLSNIPNVSGSFVGEVANADGMLFCIRVLPNGQNELWKTDSATGASLLVATLGAIPSGTGGYVIRELTAVNGLVFFNSYDATHGLELWKSHGTPNTITSR